MPLFLEAHNTHTWFILKTSSCSDALSVVIRYFIFHVLLHVDYDTDDKWEADYEIYINHYVEVYAVFNYCLFFKLQLYVCHTVTVYIKDIQQDM